MRPRLLVFNAHESWVWQLARLDADLDIVVGLPGRDVPDWDERMRPFPPNGRRVAWPPPLGAADCTIVHSLRDLLDVRGLRGPRLLVLHATLEGRAIEEGAGFALDEMRAAARQYCELTRTHVVAVSPLKARSWGFPDAPVLPFAVDPDDYLPWTGEIACGLRIANVVERRRRILRWDLHEAAFRGLPVRLVGHNPGRPGVRPARSWDELKQLLRVHRFCVHTADPALEDGYNMAIAEAMSAGLPIIGNRHPTSPIEHGVSGLLADDPEELADHARRLIADRDLARRLGRAARERARECFAPDQFSRGLFAAVSAARDRWRGDAADRAAGAVAAS